MAYQAVRHLRQRRAGNLVRLFQAAVASLTGIFRIEVAPNIARRLQIILVIDRPCDEWRHVTHPQMQRMTKLRQACGWRRRNVRVRVTLQADLLRRKEIILDPGAAGGRRVTPHTRQAHLEVETM